MNSSNYRGLWVTFEGGDGVGKSTQAEYARQYLRSIGRDVIRTREPGGTELGVQIRQLILHGKGDIDPHAEALLFAADRAQHVRAYVKPNLAAGVDVIQDRYLDSSVAYQGAGRDLDPEEVRHLSVWATEGALPELTILLDLDPAIAAARVGGRGAADRIEAEPNEFRKRLRAEFLLQADRDPDRFVIIDARLTEVEVAARVRAAITKRLLSR
ncbi:dTMP kinase [Curtobacterium sp. MCBD17_040]|uniref:dTMP kinase n=1 Tax=Curtobacterium sp. MCBD17_040 TaxID=2175674 RepID=UPI000DA8749A|nr:dTMP kinase [Curtobacterium sp. MCBD17_040]WIB65407.1 dTMP kinase [Curtobacterium sp. MCBD17_040]